VKLKSLILVVVALSWPAAATAHVRGCNTKSCDARVTAKYEYKVKLRAIRPYTAWLERTGACESGTDYVLSHGLRAYNASGPYMGRYQMGWNAWYKSGGKGSPLDASWLEQAYRAVRWRQIIARYGYGPHTTMGWPVCG